MPKNIFLFKRYCSPPFWVLAKTRIHWEDFGPSDATHLLFLLNVPQFLIIKDNCLHSKLIDWCGTKHCFFLLYLVICWYTLYFYIQTLCAVVFLYFPAVMCPVVLRPGFTAVILFCFFNLPMNLPALPARRYPQASPRHWLSTEAA